MLTGHRVVQKWRGDDDDDDGVDDDDDDNFESSPAESIYLTPPALLFRCHTYDFGATGPGICRLSHHSSATLRHVNDPYLLARGANSYEMGACFNVTIECQANYMVANVAANRMFDGKVRYYFNSPNDLSRIIGDEWLDYFT